MRLACVFAVPDTEIPYLCESVFPALWEQDVQTIVMTNGETSEHDYAIELWQAFESFAKNAHCEAPAIADSNSDIMDQLLISGAWFMVIASADVSGTLAPAIKGWQMNRPVIGYTRKGEETARTWQQNFVRELKRAPLMGVRSKTQAVAPPHVVISNNSNNLKETLDSFITHAADRIGA